MSNFSVLRNGFTHFSDHGEELIPGFSEEIKRIHGFSDEKILEFPESPCPPPQRLKDTQKLWNRHARTDYQTCSYTRIFDYPFDIGHKDSFVHFSFIKTSKFQKEKMSVLTGWKMTSQNDFIWKFGSFQGTLKPSNQLIVDWTHCVNW